MFFASYIPFIFQAAALLAAFTHPSHIVIYAPGDSFTCRRAATRNLLGIDNKNRLQQTAPVHTRNRGNQYYNG
ncbi:hypothetical protein C5468_01135 [Photorhabdus luminescens subsp. mexicana]|uniref:Secreted protein n=1 Tax=Photorhabdus luminescens subsp. mexicana TaxID=2100167 RepID=A0A4R4JPA1_PHOLU|nr:hypothetical protein C5468_01135 [Photorhabdus luminescens subsp. mexicana]